MIEIIEQASRDAAEAALEKLIADAKVPVEAEVASLKLQLGAAEQQARQSATRIAELSARIAELEKPKDEASPGLFFKKSAYTGPKKVTAHYFGPYPISIDNLPRDTDWYAKNGVNPDASGRTEYAGWFDTRPIARAPLSGNWKLEDCKNDIRAAQKFGVDVFYCDLLGTSGSNYDNYKTLVQAAEELNTGFLVAPMLDGNGAHSVQNVNTPEVAAKAIADTYWGKKSTWMIDGGFVISSFKGEARDVDWWTKLFAALKNNYGVPKVSFQMGFLNYGAAVNYSSITQGEGNWGDGDDPATIRASRDKTAEAHGRGKAFTYPVGGGQIRRASGNFDEVLNTEGVRAHWEKVIKDNPDFVQLVTWSDYSEGAVFAPNEARGVTWLVLSAYYAEWWKTGKAPAILRDEIIVSHREAKRNATPRKSVSVPLKQWTGAGRGGPFSTVRDAIEVVTFLTSAQTVTVTIGGQLQAYSAPAGMFVKTFDMRNGTVSAKAGTAAVTMFAPITETPYRQNAIYLAASAINGTAGQRVN